LGRGLFKGNHWVAESLGEREEEGQLGLVHADHWIYHKEKESNRLWRLPTCHGQKKKKKNLHPPENEKKKLDWAYVISINEGRPS